MSATGPAPLRLSVVLPTFERAEVLRRNLRQLADQTLDPQAYEIIVIDDGSKDHTATVVEDAIRSSACRITYLRHDNRGPGYTQNRGIRQASAPLILLLADDILLTPPALEAHVHAHERHPADSAAILGNVQQSPELRATAFQRKWDPFLLSRLEQDQELPYSMFWACNISLKREFMLTCGMFRDARGSAGAAAHEDVEVGHRLSRHGLRIFHERGALGLHQHAESLSSAMARSFERGLNWPEAYELMPNVELRIRQRIYGIRTLIRERRAITVERRAYLLPGDASLRGLAIDHIVRTLCFNRAMVKRFWLPIMGLAERSALLESFIHPRCYRGVVVFSFLDGVRHAGRGAVAAAGNNAPSPVTPKSSG